MPRPLTLDVGVAFLHPNVSDQSVRLECMNVVYEWFVRMVCMNGVYEWAVRIKCKSRECDWTVRLECEIGACDWWICARLIKVSEIDENDSYVVDSLFIRLLFHSKTRSVRMCA